MNIIFLLLLLVVLFLIRKPLDRLIKNLKIKSLNDKLTNLYSDVDKITKSGKTQSERDNLRSLSLTFRKSKGQKLSKKDDEWLQNHNRKSQIKKKKSESKRLTSLIEKYGSEKGQLIHKGKLDLGMTTEMVIDSKGKPKEVIEKVSRGKKREEYFYSEYKNRQGNKSYKLRVVLINGKVDGWYDIKN